jgi:5'-3' exonuclease
MKIRTLLVDSNYLLKRSFHGAKNTSTVSFGHIGGLYSFLTTTRKLIKKHSINKVVLCWDGENAGIYRNRIYREYKATRKSKEWYKKIQLTENEIRREKEKEESILKQRKRIQAYAEELFLRQIEVDKIEADDLIASYCMRYNNKEEIYLFSNDRDFSQLLDLNISIIFPNIDDPVTKRNFFMKFGYHYANVLTMKIICGDVSDNIKGISGVQEGTLIKHFPDIRVKPMTVRDVCYLSRRKNIDRAINKKKPLKALENILEGVETFKINHKLINLHEPFLNDEAIEELEQLAMPLSPEGRSSENLYKMMMEDDFLSAYGGSFVNYIQPFYAVIMNEKDQLKEFQQKKNK